jgi:1,2-diacylglycerol 3-beta-glucosyltransferase
MVLYLDGLSIAAVFWRRRPTPTDPRHRFAMLVPAHNEESLLPRLLESLSCLAYPRHLFDVYVVADNCTDRTMSIASEMGATTYTRCDPDNKGKGHALRWLITRVRNTGIQYHAYVIIDADSEVSTNFLHVMNAHLQRGDKVIQSYYGVLNNDDSWLAALRYAGLALFNNLRPQGRDALGLSAGLRGNGMCFSSSVIDRFGWDAFALTEDVELHLALVEAGIRVAYAPGAVVLAEMPTSLRQARSQNLRWERGRLQMLRMFGPRLTWQAIRRRDPAQLDAVAEQLVPPLSVLTAASGLLLLLTLVSRARRPRQLALAIVGGQIGYVVTGLRLVHAGPHVYRALLRAPFYIVWKVSVYLIAAIHLNDSRWIRTSRVGIEK